MSECNHTLSRTIKGRYGELCLRCGHYVRPEIEDLAIAEFERRLQAIRAGGDGEWVSDLLDDLDQRPP